MLRSEDKSKLVSNVNREIGKRPDIFEFLYGNKKLSDVFLLDNDLTKTRVDEYKKAYFGIGDTECYKLNLPNDNQLYLKMEYTNSMGNNHYSRFWVIHLFICEILGLISPGQTKLIEVTSGSSGIALAMACETLKFDVTIIVPEILPDNRVFPMMRSTTTIVKVKGYITDCILRLREMIKENDYFATNHSEEKADIITHIFTRIGYEIARDISHPIDFAILAMGNGTSTMAISKALKETNPDIHISAYRPKFEDNPDEIVFGLIAANIDCRHVPLAMNSIDELKYTTGIDLAPLRIYYRHDTEIKNLGYSSLYGIYMANELAKNVHGKKIITLGYDKIDRY
jgi:cysteine synthase